MTQRSLLFSTIKYISQLTKKEITMSDIKRKAELDYQIVISNLRLFTQQGVEIYQEDLPYLRDGILLCVSDSMLLR